MSLSAMISAPRVDHAAPLESIPVMTSAGEKAGESRTPGARRAF
jgi:hypothetical protein